MKNSHLKIVRLFMVLSIITPYRVWSNKAQKTACTVKVLLEEHRHTHDKKMPAWYITSSAGFFLYSPHNKAAHRFLTCSTLIISHHHKKLMINGRAYPGSELRICPKDGYAGINSTQFHGSFSIVQAKDRTYLVNHVDLEEYVFSVLKTESWPGWPVEVNKAFAVSSRSYVMAMIKQMHNSTLPYHFKNTNEHQTYRGMHNSTTIRTAVEQTKGMVLTHNNEPALTMFDSCCGGIIPAHIEDFDFEKVPYLARTYPCKHCKKCRIYSWEKEFHLASITKQLAHLCEHPGTLQEVKVAKKDKAGLVTELHIKKGKQRLPVSGKQLYTALKDIKSYCYTVKKKGDKLIFSGRGYGHHIGICQWGAREMVRDGWPYKRILDFYYPNTKLRTIV